MPVVVTPVNPTVSGKFTVTFTDINPPAREDMPWTTVQISESANLSGPWTVIDTQALSPLDPIPAQPQSRDFTTALATIKEGFYTLTFLDANGGSSHPIEQIQDVPSEIQPTLSDLGSLMRARTTVAGTGGTEAGTFTPNTRPTDTEARALIHQAVDYVLMEVGQEIPDRLILQARFLVMLYAAQLVELTFYRNEVTRDQSAYQQYVLMYQQGVRALKANIENAVPAGVQAPFWSVGVLNSQQARFQGIANALDPSTGQLDPMKLPPEMWYPRGPGGIPAAMLKLWPWLGGGDSLFSTGMDWTMLDIESPG